MVDEETRRYILQHIDDVLAKDPLVTSYEITAVPDGYEIDYWFRPAPTVRKISIPEADVREMIEWARRDLAK